MVGRIWLPNEPDGGINSTDMFQFGLGVTPSWLSDTQAYHICSSTNPDVLDLYVSGEKIVKITSA